MSKAIRVLIVDDHALLRDGIATLISTCSDIVVVGEAATGRDAIAAHRELRPDVTLMDLQMSDMDGIEAIEAIREESPQARIIVLTTYSGDVRAQRAFKAGARGYTLKNHVRRDLLDTIRHVFSGHKHVHPEVANQIAEHSGDVGLTARERDVLTLVADGRSNKWIAQELKISDDTVKGHVSNILAKLHANDRTHAVTLAIKRGVIHL